MKKNALLGAVLASTMILAACGDGNKAASTAATNSTAAAPASGNTAAPASANSAAPAASPASGADRTNQNFTLNNRSQNTITHVYVSPVSDSNWGEDILGQDVLPAGESAQITFPRAETECQWDIRVTIDGDQNQELRGIDLCTTTDVNYDG